MMRDPVSGWRPIERITTALMHFTGVSVMRATQWTSPAGFDATLVTCKVSGRGPIAAFSAVSVPTIARDADLSPGSWVVDPQLCWHDIDDRRFLVAPAVGLRVSVRSYSDVTSDTARRAYRRPCRVVIAALSGDGDAFDWQGTIDWASVAGTYPGFVTRWPLPVSDKIQVVSRVESRRARLATGPAVFLREERDDPIAV